MLLDACIFAYKSFPSIEFSRTFHGCQNSTTREGLTWLRASYTNVESFSISTQGQIHQQLQQTMGTKTATRSYTASTTTSTNVIHCGSIVNQIVAMFPSKPCRLVTSKLGSHQQNKEHVA